MNKWVIAFIVVLVFFSPWLVRSLFFIREGSFLETVPGHIFIILLTVLVVLLGSFFFRK